MRYLDIYPEPRFSADTGPGLWSNSTLTLLPRSQEAGCAQDKADLVPAAPSLLAPFMSCIYTYYSNTKS